MRSSPSRLEHGLGHGLELPAGFRLQTLQLAADVGYRGLLKAELNRAMAEIRHQTHQAIDILGHIRVLVPARDQQANPRVR